MSANDFNLVTSNPDTSLLTNGNYSISFSLKANTIPIIEFNDSGDIYVKGNLIENDKELVQAFREFLASGGYMKP